MARHGTQGGSDVEMQRALEAWAKEHGRRWKAALREAWLRGDDLGADLQRARNVLGPSGLDRVRLPVTE